MSNQSLFSSSSSSSSSSSGRGISSFVEIAPARKAAIDVAIQELTGAKLINQSRSEGSVVSGAIQEFTGYTFAGSSSATSSSSAVAPTAPAPAEEDSSSEPSGWSYSLGCVQALAGSTFSAVKQGGMLAFDLLDIAAGGKGDLFVSPVTKKKAVSKEVEIPVETDPLEDYYTALSASYLKDEGEVFPLSLENFKAYYQGLDEHLQNEPDLTWLSPELKSGASKLDRFIEKNQLFDVIKGFYSIERDKNFPLTLHGYTVLALNYDEEYVDGVEFVRKLTKELNPDMLNAFLDKGFLHKNAVAIERRRDRYKSMFLGSIKHFFYSFSGEYKMLNKVSLIRRDLHMTTKFYSDLKANLLTDLFEDLRSQGVDRAGLEDFITKLVNGIDLYSLLPETDYSQVFIRMGLGDVAIKKIVDNLKFYIPSDYEVNSEVRLTPGAVKAKVRHSLMKGVLRNLDRQWAIEKTHRLDFVGGDFKAPEGFESRSAPSKAAYKLKLNLMAQGARLTQYVGRFGLVALINAQYAKVGLLD